MRQLFKKNINKLNKIMKSFFTFILLVSFISTVTYAQDRSGQSLEFKPKSKMRNTGLILLGTGVATFASGIALGVHTGGFSYNYDNTNGHVTETGKPINGVAGILTIMGAMSTSCGIVFTIIGQNRIKKQKHLSLNVLPTGLNFCYKF